MLGKLSESIPFYGEYQTFKNNIQPNIKNLHRLEKIQQKMIDTLNQGYVDKKGHIYPVKLSETKKEFEKNH